MTYDRMTRWRDTCAVRGQQGPRAAAGLVPCLLRLVEVAPAKVTAERGCCCRGGRWWRRRWVARLRERPGPGPAQRPRQQRSPILRTTELRNHGPSYLAADSFSGGIICRYHIINIVTLSDCSYLIHLIRCKYLMNFKSTFNNESSTFHQQCHDLIAGFTAGTVW